MDYDNADWQIKHYSLPKAFWVALLEVRNHWLQDEAFADLLYSSRRNNPLRQAFDLMDNILERELQEDEMP